MRRGRLLILGVILAMATAVIVLIALSRGITPAPPPPTPEGGPTAAPPTTKVWVALQPIPRGGEFVPGTLGLRDWPNTNVPPDVIGDQSETVGRVATRDVFQGEPILRTMLTAKGTTNQAALLVPQGRVAVAFPIDEQSSVAYAIQPGDYVDVLIMASFIDIDTEFQTELPNLIAFFNRSITATVQTAEAHDQGRIEVPPGLPGDNFTMVYPRERQRPRRVAQLTVPAAKVLRMGPWIETASTQAPTPVATGQAAAPPPPPQIVTLAVEPQDALVLLWARKSEMYMELALRAPGSEEARYQPEAVTLQYMLTRFNIAVPPKLEFGFAREAIQNVGLTLQPTVTPTPQAQ